MRQRTVRVTAFHTVLTARPLSLTALLALGLASVAPAHDTLRILLLVDDTIARAAETRGVRLGADEAAHTGALFGTDVALRVAQAHDSTEVARALATAFAPAPPSIVVAAAGTAACVQIYRALARAPLPVLDAGCEADDSLRTLTVYSLGQPHAAQRADDSTRIVLWHHSLERFGAEQLNQRYERRFHGHMDAPAWAGWMATKIALDLALRAHSTVGAALLQRLGDPRVQFDGQKGRSLQFSRDDRRLVQPMYRVAGVGDQERVVAEVAP